MNKVLDDMRNYAKNMMRKTSAPDSIIGFFKPVFLSDMVASSYGGCNKNENKQVKEATVLTESMLCRRKPCRNTSSC